MRDHRAFGRALCHPCARPMSDIQLAPAQCLAEQTPEEWEAVLRGWGEPRYRALQIFRWIHQRGILSPAEMTDVPKRLRDRLGERVPAKYLDFRDADWTRGACATPVVAELVPGKLVDVKLVELLYFRAATACIVRWTGGTEHSMLVLVLLAPADPWLRPARARPETIGPLYCGWHRKARMAC